MKQWEWMTEQFGHHKSYFAAFDSLLQSKASLQGVMPGGNMAIPFYSEQYTSLGARSGRNLHHAA